MHSHLLCIIGVVVLTLSLVITPSHATTASLSTVTPVSFPATGSYEITLIGVAFVGSSVIAISNVGVCQSSRWGSSSEIIAKTPAGGNLLSLNLVATIPTTGSPATILTKVGAVGYAAAEITGVSPPNGPTLSDLGIFVLGKNFGKDSSATPVVSVRAVTCANSGWVSDSALSCRFASGSVSTLAAGGGSDTTILFAMDGGPETTGELTSSFTFNRIFLNPANHAATGAMSVTVIGSGFLTQTNTQPTVSSVIGSSGVEATVWTASSCVAIKMPSAPSGSSNVLAVTVGSYSGIQASPAVATDRPNSGVFYIPANVTSVPFMRSTGASSVTVITTSLGVKADTIRSRIGRTAAVATQWGSESVVVAGRSTVSTRGVAKCMISALKRQSTSLTTISFDTPIIGTLNATSCNGPPGGSHQLTPPVTVYGYNNFVVDHTLKMRVGGTGSDLTIWKSDSSAVARIPASSWLLINDRAFFMTVARVIGTVTHVYSYNAISLSVTNIPTTGSRVILLSAWGFTNTTPIVTVGSVPCQSASWLSNMTVSCKVPQLSTPTANVTLQLGTGMREINTKISVDILMPTASAPANIPTTGAASVTLSGASFIMSDTTAAMRIGSTGTEGAAWTSDSSVVSKAPSSPPDQPVITLSIQTVQAPLNAQLVSDTPPVIMLFIASTVQLFSVDQFQTNLATILQIQVAEIQVLSVAPASVRVTMRILREDWRDKYQAMNNDLVSTDSLLRSQIHVSSIVDFTTGNTVEPSLPDQGSSNIKFNSRITLAVIAAAVGTSFMLIAAYSVVVIYRAAKSRKRKRARDQEEAVRMEERMIS